MAIISSMRFQQEDVCELPNAVRELGIGPLTYISLME
jgi:hypothetical protein